VATPHTASRRVWSPGRLAHPGRHDRQPGPGAGTLAGHGLAEATLGTLQRTLLAVPARLTRSARRYHLHLPTGWPWQTHLTWLKRRIDALPLIT